MGWSRKGLSFPDASTWLRCQFWVTSRTGWCLQGPVTGTSLRDAERSLALERQSWSADWRKGSRRRLGNLNPKQPTSPFPAFARNKMPGVRGHQKLDRSAHSPLLFKIILRFFPRRRRECIKSGKVSQIIFVEIMIHTQSPVGQHQKNVSSDKHF